MNNEMTEKYFVKFQSNDLLENIKDYFSKFHKKDILKHTLEVVTEIKRIADVFNINKEKCIKAAYLHDVGRVVNNDELVLFCDLFGQKVDEEEKIFPSILHQKASRVIAEKVFEVEDIQILNSIECHTTLKANPSDIDMAVFLADKLSWKEDEHQDLINKMRIGLKHSKERAILYYQENLYNRREALLCYHKWARESYRYHKKVIDCMITKKEINLS